MQQSAIPVKVKLNYPIRTEDGEISEIVFPRRPTAGDLRGIKMSDLDNIDNILTVTSRLTGIVPTFLHALDVTDLVAVSEEVLFFFGDGRPT